MPVDTRRLILEKSYALFQSQGYSATGMRQVAEACGISVGNLCYHFKKKEDLFMSFYLELFSRFALLLADSTGGGLDPWTSFIARERCFLYKCASDPSYRKSYIDAVNIPTLRDDYIRLHHERFIDIFGAGYQPANAQDLHTASLIVSATEFQLMDTYARHRGDMDFDAWFMPVFRVHMDLLAVPRAEQERHIREGIATGREIYSKTVFEEHNLPP